VSGRLFEHAEVSREERLEAFVEWLRRFAALIPTEGDRRKMLMAALEELGPRPVKEASDGNQVR